MVDIKQATKQRLKYPPKMTDLPENINTLQSQQPGFLPKTFLAT